MESVSEKPGSQALNLEAEIRQRLGERRILLMTHLIVGYPSLEANWEMLEVMAEVGVDIVELQLPFSEPIADGPTFARANQIALERGIRTDAYFDFFRRAAGRFDFPHLMMGYYNVAFRMGHKNFCQQLSDSGGWGYILPDLPFEEYGDLFDCSRAHSVAPILLMTPTNTPERLAQIGGRSTGFVYVVARKGVTGRRTELDVQLDDFLEQCRTNTPLPLALGFGLQRGDDLRGLQGRVEMGIVGSALLDRWDADGLEGYRELLTELGAARN